VRVKRHPAAPSATYSDSVEVTGPGRWVFVSGQLAAGSSEASVEGRLAEEADACFTRIEEALARHGASLGDVVRITAYLTSLEHFGEFAEARGRWFGADGPASTAVQVAGLLGGALVEIDAVAFVE
jgi:2-iminobutanoate/2-iminopropanoate deaminase